MSDDAATREASPRHPWRAGVFLALLHAALGFACWAGGVAGQDADTHAGWDWFWQMIPVADMRTQPWGTLWHLHYQPPGYSLWALLWLEIFGADLFPESIHFANILIGACTVAFGWRLALILSGGRKLALVAGFVLAVDPSLLLFEAYYLYDTFVTTLVMLSAWLLWKTLQPDAGRRRNLAWLCAFIFVLNYLVMTRSLFHWIFLWVALLFALPAWNRLRLARRAVLFLVAIAIPGLWYAKNQREYGFFGASSWFGIGLYKCVMVHYDYYEMKDLETQGVIPHYVMERSPYQHTPSDYRIFGFNRASEWSAFSRDDFRNINMIEISRGYEQAARSMIVNHPGRYLKSMLSAYVVFSDPPSAFSHLFDLKVGLLKTWESIFTNFVCGKLITDQIRIFTGREFGSPYFFYFPFLVLFGTAWAVRRFSRNPHDRPRAILMGYFVYISAYVALVGNMFEIGENMRFRLASTPLTLIMMLMALRAGWRRIPAGFRDKLRFKLK